MNMHELPNYICNELINVGYELQSKIFEYEKENVLVEEVYCHEEKYLLIFCIDFPPICNSPDNNYKFFLRRFNKTNLLLVMQTKRFMVKSFATSHVESFGSFQVCRFKVDGEFKRLFEWSYYRTNINGIKKIQLTLLRKNILNQQETIELLKMLLVKIKFIAIKEKRIIEFNNNFHQRYGSGLN